MAPCRGEVTKGLLDEALARYTNNVSLFPEVRAGQIPPELRADMAAVELMGIWKSAQVASLALGEAVAAVGSLGLRSERVAPPEDPVALAALLGTTRVLFANRLPSPAGPTVHFGADFVHRLGVLGPLGRAEPYSLVKQIVASDGAPPVALLGNGVSFGGQQMSIFYNAVIGRAK